MSVQVISIAFIISCTGVFGSWCPGNQFPQYPVPEPCGLSYPGYPSYPEYQAVPEASPAPVIETVPVLPTYNPQPEVPVYAQSIIEQPALLQPRPVVYGSIECGPSAKIEPIRLLKPLILPPVNEAIRVLPSPPLPPPTVIANKCHCTKTVQKPQLFQRIIQVQKNQRFLKKTFVPRVEKVSYNAKPRC